jgi:CDP-diacylglycerol--glycerol-3-phosphate 3-phosphatidyltransferase
MNIIAITETSLKRVTDGIENSCQKTCKFFPSWITPDHLTYTRIVSSFPTAFFLLIKRPTTAFWFFIFGASLDFWDGKLARFRKQETDVGKVIDPIADKLLTVFPLAIIFVSKGSSFLSPLLFWPIMVLESALLLMGGKAIMTQKGIKRRLGANLWGKWKFFFQAIGISFLLLEKPFWAQLVLWPSVVLAIASIIGHLTFKAPEQS